MATPQARHPAMFPPTPPPPFLLCLSVLGVPALIDILLLTSQRYIHENPMPQKPLLRLVNSLSTEVIQAFTVKRHFAERANRFKMAKGIKVLVENSSEG